MVMHRAQLSAQPVTGGVDPPSSVTMRDESSPSDVGSRVVAGGLTRRGRGGSGRWLP